MSDEDDPPPTDPAKAWETAYPDWDAMSPAAERLPPLGPPRSIWGERPPIGIFLHGLRGRVLDQSGARELVAAWSWQDLDRDPKQRFHPALTAMTIIDSATHADLPPPECSIRLVAKLGGKKLLRHDQRLRAWRLTADGRSDIPIVLGITEDEAEKLLRAHPVQPEPDVDAIIAYAGKAQRRPAMMLQLHTLLRDYADRGQALTYPAWWATALGLGVASVETGRLTRDAIIGLTGVANPDEFLASARSEGLARFKLPPGVTSLPQRQGPQRKLQLNIVSSANSLPANRRTLDAWATGPAVLPTPPNRAPLDDIREAAASWWVASPWQRTAAAVDMTARWSRGKKPLSRTAKKKQQAEFEARTAGRPSGEAWMASRARQKD